jgi:streptogramin lyase
MRAHLHPRRLALAVSIAALAVALGTTPGGAIDETTPYDVTDDLPFVQRVEVGPDGSVWAHGEEAIGRLDPATGDVDPLCPLTEADFPDLEAQHLFEIAPDGQIWIPWTPDSTDVPAGLRIIRLDPATCTTDDFELTDAEHGPADIEALADGTVWVSTFHDLLLIDGDDGTPIDAINGTFPYFDSMVVRGGMAFGARRSDGTLWTIDLSDGTATELSPSGLTYITEVVAGPDGRVWFAGADAADGVIVGSVAADGSDLQSSGLEYTGTISGVTFGPDGNLWLANTTPSELAVVAPAGPTVLRTVDFVELGFIPGALAADATSIWAAVVRDSTLVRITAVQPVQPPATPSAPTTSPTGAAPAPAPAAAAQPATASPRFTG